VKATVAVTVMAVNDAPKADPDSALVQEELPAFISVLADDDAGPSDEATEELFIDGIVERPEHGTTVIGPGWVQYRPAPDYSGPDWFTYRLCDGGDPSLCSTGSVDVEVIPVNDPPGAKDDAATSTEGAPISLDVLANDDGGPFDEAGEGLRLAGIVWSPAHGEAVVEAGVVRYTPAAGYLGWDSLVYRVCDDRAPVRCTTATAIVQLRPGIGSRPRLQSEAHTGAIRFRRGRFSGRAASRGPRSAS
jgi:large repetitive protein